MAAMPELRRSIISVTCSSRAGNEGFWFAGWLGVADCGGCLKPSGLEERAKGMAKTLKAARVQGRQVPELKREVLAL